jgi:flagellar biosynthesis chaperone FliJ
VTIRPRAARALRDARTRLRDVAAASHARSAADRDRERDALAAEHHRLEEHLDAAGDALAAARSVHDLDTFEDLTGAHRLAVSDASARHRAASAAADATALALRERSRQLRAAEHLVDRVEDLHGQRASRDEQRAHDDLAARRR